MAKAGPCNRWLLRVVAATTTSHDEASSTTLTSTCGIEDERPPHLSGCQRAAQSWTRISPLTGGGYHMHQRRPRRTRIQCSLTLVVPRIILRWPQSYCSKQCAGRAHTDRLAILAARVPPVRTFAPQRRPESHHKHSSSQTDEMPSIFESIHGRKL